MPLYTVVSMYTVDTPYEQEVERLRESLRAFDINHEIYPIESTGNWVKNAQIKAIVIHKALLSMDTNVVWLDADAIVLARPTLFEHSEYDFSAVFQKRPATEQHRLLSGTMFFQKHPESDCDR